MSLLVLRAGPWRAQLGLVAGGALLGVLGLLLGGVNGLRALQLGGILVGTAAAMSLDEPAAEVVDACAVSLRVRTVVRLLGFAAALGLVAGTWSLLGAGPPRLLELGGTALLGAGPAALLRTRVAEPGDLVAAPLLLILLTFMLVGVVGDRAPLYPLGPPPDRTYWLWGVLSALALASLAACTGSSRSWARPRRGSRASG